MVSKLPRSVPIPRWRLPDPLIPPSLELRQRFWRYAREHVKESVPVPPLPVSELKVHARQIMKKHDISSVFEDYLGIMVNNALWEDKLAGIPYERRLLLLPKCLRLEEKCTARFDEFGLLCKSCGQCSLQDLQAEAERLGYAVLIAEGSAIVTAIIETGKIEAIVGVSCVSVLEKAFPFMEAAAIPGVAIPLLQSDCHETTVDTDWVWDVIHMTKADRTRRLDLDALKAQAQQWFSHEALNQIMGSSLSPVDEIARKWLAKDGKRWRPFLAATVFDVLQNPENAMKLFEDQPESIKKIAVAVECFHKASLIHDDIADGDLSRYGAKTLHAEHGVPIALNVGDLLIGEGYRLISESMAGPEKQEQLVKIAADGQRLLCHGQGEELSWVHQPKELTPQEVISIFRKKTSPAFEVALSLGAVLAGSSEKVLSVLKEYSEALGIAYQIHDDLEDDLDIGMEKELRPSITLAMALKKARGQDKLFLKHMFSKTKATRSECETLKEVYRKLEIRQEVSRLKNGYRDEAVRTLAQLEDPNLKGLLRRMVEKIFRTEEVKEWCSEFEARNDSGGQARNLHIV